MFHFKKSCGLSFALARSCLILFILAHFTVTTLAISGEETYLRGEISQIPKTKEIVQSSYDYRTLENDGLHSGHSHSDHSHSGHSHSGDGAEESNSPSTSAVVIDAPEESQYQMNLESASSYAKNPLSSVIVVCVSMLYAGVAFGVFLLIRRKENIEDDRKDMLLVSSPSMKTIYDEKKLAGKCCAIIGVKRPTGLVNHTSSFNIA